MLSSKSWKKVLLLAGTAAAMVILAGCGTAEGHITLYHGGRWKGDFDFTISREMLALAGGEAALDAELQAGMEEEMVKAREEGVQVSWQKTRSDEEAVTYRLSMGGNNLDSLKSDDDLEAWVEVDREGTRLVHFRFTPRGLEGIMQFAFSLTGGEIISSNADRVEGGTATWYDLSGGRTAEAVLTEAPPGALEGLYIPLLGGLALVAVVVALATLLARKRPLRAAAVPAARFCTQCGARNSPTAKFCIRCGKAMAG